MCQIAKGTARKRGTIGFSGGAALGQGGWVVKTVRLAVSLVVMEEEEEEEEEAIEQERKSFFSRRLRVFSPQLAHLCESSLKVSLSVCLSRSLAHSPSKWGWGMISRSL